jgi:hypothetical protein
MVKNRSKQHLVRVILLNIVFILDLISCAPIRQQQYQQQHDIQSHLSLTSPSPEQPAFRTFNSTYSHSTETIKYACLARAHAMVLNLNLNNTLKPAIAKSTLVTKSQTVLNAPSSAASVTPPDNPPSTSEPASLTHQRVLVIVGLFILLPVSLALLLRAVVWYNGRPGSGSR